MKKKKIILGLVFILTLVLLLFFSYKFISNIIIFNNHRDYFNQPFNEQQIQTWMSINYIEKKYNIDLEEKFGNKIGIWTRNKTLDDYCNKSNIDCDKLLLILNDNKYGD